MLQIILSSNQELRLSLVIDQAFQVRTQHALSITLLPDVSATIIDDLHEWGYFNTKIELIVQENAKAFYLMKAVEKGEFADVAEDQILEKEIIVQLVGRQAVAEVVCLCFGSGKKSFKFKTVQNHRAEKATSKVLVKSVLDDESKLYCHSLIHVDEKAQQTVADQVNKNILLKNSARAVSVPTLEVLANDVRCKHGAAVSKIDPEQMFYLQSRGIDAQATREMLIEAFLN